MRTIAIKPTTGQVKLGRSFHQQATVKIKVGKSDTVPLWDSTTRRHPLAECKQTVYLSQHHVHL